MPYLVYNVKKEKGGRPSEKNIPAKKEAEEKRTWL